MAVNRSKKARYARRREKELLHYAKEEWLIPPRLAESVTPATDDAFVRWLLEP